MYEVRRAVFSQMADNYPNQLELAERLKLSAGYISHLKTGYRPITEKSARKFERLLNLPSGYFDKKSQVEEPKGDYKSVESNAEFIGSPDLWDSDTPIGANEVALPFYREVEFSAGNGRSHVVENGGRKLRFAKSTLRDNQIQPNHAACVTVSGNSMEPVMQHGTTVGIDTSATRIIDGEVYAIDHDGQLRVKLLYRQPGGGLRIKSFNSDEYPDEILNEEQSRSVKVLGWVFWISTIRKRRF